ncbi:MAG: tRNA pseudouridine(55) synthase TruB [Treponema sp.]|nr:tRNA pseudouridine(55) synthase TruB [Treponema sp.]
MTERSGILLLNKSPGRTSFESLNAVKKALATRKVGHTGTLDKFASGLLVVLSGWALKLSPWFDRCDKRYRGTIRFGVETDTLDGEGKPVAQADPPGLEALERALEQFRGDIMQAPPAYSAIHLDGRRAYELARSGLEPKMEKRPVRIHALELCSYDPPLAEVWVHCSKGAYIRSLARDIALAAGSRAYLDRLERLRVAGFDLADAASAEASDLAAALRPIRPDTFESLGLPWANVDEAAAKYLRQGKPPDRLVEALLPASVRETVPQDSLALFCGPSFVAVMTKKAGGDRRSDQRFYRWSYGYVHADP